MSEKSKTTKSKTKKTKDTPKEPKKTTTKKTTAKKTEAAPKSKTSSKKTTAKEAKPKKTTTKKTTAKKAEAKPKKTTAKKTTAKKAEAKPKKPAAKKTAAKKAEAKPKKTAAKKLKAKKAPAKAKKVAPKGPLTREAIRKTREFKLAHEMRRRQPAFRHDQAHRWVRVKDSWRKVRGIDSPTRQKRRGRIAMVESGYRKPRLVRGLHPSGFVEVLVHRPADLEGLNPEIHAVRIAGTVGDRKREDIIKRAEAMMIRVLNAGAPESVMEEDLFTELEGIDMEVGTR